MSEEAGVMEVDNMLSISKDEGAKTQDVPSKK